MLSFYGLLNLPWWGYVIAVLLLTHVTIVAVTVFLHRHQAHRALDLHPLMSHFFRLWLWLTTGMVTKEWVAVHRKHHAHCETEQDPHSPRTYGIKTVLWEGADLYRHAVKTHPEMMEKFGHATPNDGLERHLYSRFRYLGIIIMLLLDIVLLGVPGVAVWAIQMMWIPFFAAGVINGIGHYFGYRNFEAADTSTNVSPWGILIGGEELHNNHHAYASSAKFSVKPWEFDIGWLYIRLMESCKLAHVKKRIPTGACVAGKSEVDNATLKAVVQNRLQLLSKYQKDVLQPTFKAERARQGESVLNSTASKLLKRDQRFFSNAEHQALEQVLVASKAVELVYQFRAKLQDIWSQKASSQKEVLEALKQWCLQAEASGEKRLQEFVSYLRGYVLTTQAH
ncbi:DesA family fatty acid desaturase [Piscirickettsia litoralis]|uniref:Aminotransferase n=1 Tax=Piscirickettsia litoralis TaxID=1891921 RepID=A0ABX3A738_9GAMM|nr:fatty acid desaturase [Piscirickettsia litoralis]ODN43340.1 aminotransferase [Piscirickettsia litoralis]